MDQRFPATPPSRREETKFMSLGYYEMRNTSMETASITFSDDTLKSPTSTIASDESGSSTPDSKGSPFQTPVFTIDERIAVSFQQRLQPSDSEQSTTSYSSSYLDNKRRRKTRQFRSWGRFRHVSSKLRYFICFGLAVFGGLSFNMLRVLHRQPGSFEYHIPYQPHQMQSRWRSFLSDQAPALTEAIQSTKPTSQFTVRLSGRRFDQLQRVRALARCDRVFEIQLEDDVDFDPHSIPKVKGKDDDPKLSTHGVLVLKDDAHFTCEALNRAFHLWRSHPDRLVGFFPTLHTRHVWNMSGEKLVEYKLIDQSHTQSGAYTLLSDKAVFVHKKYLEAFPSDDFADESCQEFALSIFSTAISKKAPLAVTATAKSNRKRAHPQMMPQQLSFHSLTAHRQAEVSNCLRQLLEGHNLQTLPSEGAQFLGS